MHKEPDSYKKANLPKLSEFAFLFENEVKRSFIWVRNFKKTHQKCTLYKLNRIMFRKHPHYTSFNNSILKQ
ncbi:hypothetical protein CW306_20810 [Bacillus sp. BA3]|nr:hypothetical protein CW306_20810 [Bacillus sp. BA3]